MARVVSFRVSRPVLGSVTPKQVREVPEIREGRKALRCWGVANLEMGWVASGLDGISFGWEVGKGRLMRLGIFLWLVIF